MKTIKIFLASSEELDNDRMAFGNLVRRLDDMYEKRGIRIKLFEWEDYDSAYNDRRKQDEYNDYVRQSDIFLALFHKKAGSFTVEEFNLASKEFKEHASPKVYTFCKDLKPGEEETPELAEFKKRLFDEMGHYWCRYDTRESLQLQFVMQLQLVESSQTDALKVEDGKVTFDGLCVAHMDKLQFAAANEDYIKTQTELHDLHDEIEELQLDLDKKQQKLEKKKAKLEKDPDDEDYKEEYEEVKEEVDKLVDRLQPKLNKYNKLKDEFAEYQTLLFNTAKRVAQLQGERITERMRRAMDAFNKGKVREANIILDEAEADAHKNLEDYKQSKEITELKRQAVISSIEELLLKTSTVMADATIPIEKRIDRTDKLYAQADELAKETDYNKEKYTQLLFDYAGFSRQHARYKKAVEIYKRLIALDEVLYGEEHIETAYAYAGIGFTYYHIDDCLKALQYHLKALNVREIMLGKKHPKTAVSYYYLGLLYDNLGDYSKALIYKQKALEVFESFYGEENYRTASAINEVGTSNYYLENYSKAREYYQKALYIRQKLLSTNDTDIAQSYNNLGVLYNDSGNYQEALKYHQKALDIRKMVLGINHPYTATSYNNIASVYSNLGEKNKALEYYFKALSIQKKVYGENHSDIALLYHNIGAIYSETSEYNKALDFYQKALEIRTEVLGKEHPDLAVSYNNISDTYRQVGNYAKALEFRQKLLKYHLNKSGDASEDLVIAYNNVGAEYRELKQFDKALENIGKAYEIANTIKDDTLKATFLNRLGRTYAAMGDTETARAKFQTAIDLLPPDHPDAIDSKERLEKLKK